MTEAGMPRIKDEHAAIMKALMDAVHEARNTQQPVKVAFMFAGMEVWVRP